MIWPHKLKVLQAMRLPHKRRTLKSGLHIENQTVDHSEAVSHSEAASHSGFATDL